MAQFARTDSQIRADRLILRKSWFQGSRIEPLFRIALRGTKDGESQVWSDSRESLERYENRGLLWIDSRESIHANRPDSSAGH